jgi:hypothetical protein
MDQSFLTPYAVPVWKIPAPSVWQILEQPAWQIWTPERALEVELEGVLKRDDRFELHRSGRALVFHGNHAIGYVDIDVRSNGFLGTVQSVPGVGPVEQARFARARLAQDWVAEQVVTWAKRHGPQRLR